MSSARHLTSTATQPASLARFIAAIEAELDVTEDHSRIAGCVSEQLATLVRDPDVLAPEFREASAECYRSHLVALAPSRRFSVMSLVWLPGQATPIHDHACWCVVGVLQGLEREERFSLRADDAGSRWLCPTDDVSVHVGEVSTLIPPEENIHRVRNAGESLAISIHVYGADLSILGTSINQRFDEVPIRHDATTGVPVAWRSVGE